MVNDAERDLVIPSPDLTFCEVGRIHSGYRTPEMGRAPNGQSQNLSLLQGVMICNIYFRCCADEHSARSSASINSIEIALVWDEEVEPVQCFRVRVRRTANAPPR